MKMVLSLIDDKNLYICMFVIYKFSNEKVHRPGKL